MSKTKLAEDIAFAARLAARTDNRPWTTELVEQVMNEYQARVPAEEIPARQTVFRAVKALSATSSSRPAFAVPLLEFTEIKPGVFEATDQVHRYEDHARRYRIHQMAKTKRWRLTIKHLDGTAAGDFRSIESFIDAQDLATAYSETNPSKTADARKADALLGMLVLVQARSFRRRAGLDRRRPTQ